MPFGECEQHPDPLVEEVLSRFDITLASDRPAAYVEALRGPEAPPTEGRYLQVLLCPSFSPEIMLIAHERRETTILWASTAQTLLRSWRPYHRYIKRDPVPPRLVTATVDLPSSDAARLWEAARRLEAKHVAQRWGLDGIKVNIAVRLGQTLADIECWSPPVGDPVRDLVDLFSTLADPMPDVLTGVLAEALRGFRVSSDDASAD